MLQYEHLTCCFFASPIHDYPVTNINLNTTRKRGGSGGAGLAAPMSITNPSDNALTPSANHEKDVPRVGSTSNEKMNDLYNDEKTSSIENEANRNSTRPTPSTPSPEESLATRALHFASTANPSTLAGVALGFAAVTYVVLGRVGLLLIGAFAGVLGFIAWEARHPEVARAVRGEQGIDVLDRLQLGLKDLRPETEGKHGDEDDEQFAIKALDEFRPETREALGGLIDAIVRDYVKWWYSPIIPTDHSFPLACRKTLTSYILAISNHIYRKRPADAFLDLLTNASSMVIVFMSELASAFADLPPEVNLSAADTVSHYLVEHPDSHLANLLNPRQQSAKFRMVAEDLLRFLDRDSRSCDPARLFLREIISNSILENLLQTCSKAEWINGWIVYLLEAGEPDLNQAIDVGMQTGRDSMPNAFADMDGNVGNIGLAKPRSSLDADKGRRKEASQSHRKKLSKADEEMEVAMEEMKKLNDMIVADEQRRRRASTIRESSERPRPVLDEMEAQMNVAPDTHDGNTMKLSPQGKSVDEASATSESTRAPISPQSIADSGSPDSSPRTSGGANFTNFDQIAPKAQVDETGDDVSQHPKAPLTLHNASFTLHDDANGENHRIRNKPVWDYLIQVEPSSAVHSGWMIVRRYSDFETLHEILRRIAAISGATAFTELHRELPAWKIHTRESLRGELERYLRDACWYQSLAESEGMKRFLEKSQGHTHGDSKSFGWEIVGKNMLDVLAIAPKGAMEGGKTLVGGVQGVFGNFPGLSRKSTNQSIDLTTSANRLSLTTPPRMENPKSPARSDRASLDSQRSSIVSQQPGKMAPMERRPSYQSQSGDADGDYFRMGRADRMDSISGPGSARASREHSRASSLAAIRSPSSISLDKLNLPPHPDEIPDDYEFPSSAGMPQSKSTDNLNASLNSPNGPVSPAPLSGKRLSKAARQYNQLSEPETHVAVELIFAVINEMYTLSSAWNIRRTLLAAAKSFLLRPGNPSLLTVQSLIQNSVLDANTSDAGIAAQLRKVRENSMPTEQERAAWPAEMTTEEKEKLRVRARQLLIRSGVPAALMGVMGQAATSEALGRVFDCLQIEEVARGLVFGLMLQFVRLITH